MTDDQRHTPRVFSLAFSRPGLVVAAAFFSLSLFPSLLPRQAMFQGVVSGIAVTIGYGLGALGEWIWNYLGIPPLRGRARKITVGVFLAIVAFMVMSAMWQHVGWQNNVRALFGMDSVSVSRWITIVPATLLVAALILIVVRSIRRLFGVIAGLLDRIVPGRLAAVVGGFALFLFLYFLATGVLVETFFAAANAMFSTRDTATVEGAVQPQSPLKSGSPESLVTWETLGRQGRSFVSLGPTVDDLNAFHGDGAIEPIRVYAGLKSADTLQGRADLVLDELIRTNAFEREVLVVATTTGTGFLDPNAVDPLEYVYNGDSAIAGVQYSYLPSWISLLADQKAVKETSRVVFDTVHEHWAALPEDERPELYLYGLSLGSFGVESILTSINILNEPIDGAFMSGPPFVNDLHAQITEDRDPGSAPWRPIFEDGRTVRFTTQEFGLDIPTADWGPTRLVYLQHGSDPVVFFSQDLAFDAPDWLIEDDQRPPDVPEEMVWIPIVTMWQVALDLPAAGSIPEGFGHLYTKTENALSWVSLTQPAEWSDDDTETLVGFLEGLD